MTELQNTIIIMIIIIVYLYGANSTAQFSNEPQMYKLVCIDQEQQWSQAGALRYPKL